MAQPPPSTHVRSRSFAASERGPGMLGLLRDALSTESGRRYYFCTSEHPPGGTGTAKRTSEQENTLFGRMVNLSDHLLGGCLCGSRARLSREPEIREEERRNLVKNIDEISYFFRPIGY